MLRDTNTSRAWLNRWATAFFAMIVLSFVTATAIGQWRMRMLDEAVSEIADTTTLAIEHLAVARGEVRDLQGALRFLGTGPEGEQTVGDARRAAFDSVDGYLALPVAPADRELWQEIFESRTALESSLARLEAQVEAGASDTTLAASRADFGTLATDINAAITRAISLNAIRSRDLALEIKQVRTTTLYIAIAMDVACAAIAVCGAVLLRRSGRAHGALVQEHLRLQEERASELEQFAGRVAHDILSPLSTVGLSLQLVARTETEPERTRYIARGVAALERVKRLVSGLLDFARAGAAPDGDERTDVADVVADLRTELEPAARATGVELSVKHGGECTVTCNPGVLTSLVSNLARNAIKYIGDGPTRRVEVRSFERGDFVRVEVEDTGPGLAPDVEHRIFDAYARTRNTKQPGIGLGLATVKRLAEAHGGKVGAVSVPAKGCTFWFELPKARALQDHAPARAAYVA